MKASEFLQDNQKQGIFSDKSWGYYSRVEGLKFNSKGTRPPYQHFYARVKYLYYMQLIDRIASFLSLMIRKITVIL